MKKLFYSTLFGLSAFLILPQIVLASDPWPSNDLTGTEIANYSDASGIIYHERLGTFFVVQNSGCVRQININGTELSHWCPSSWTDFEGITVADYNSNYLYLALESPQKIYEFDLVANSLTGKSWTLNSMFVASGSGLEALEYVNGYFYAGSQYNGKIYVYQIDLTTSSTVAPIREFYPYSGYTIDLSALSYSAETDTLYALYDSGNRLVTMNGEGTYINRYQLPSGTMNEEGFVVVPNCPNSTTYAIITEDSGRVMRFSNFLIDNSHCAVTLIDNDHDGYTSDVDCNDSSTSIHALQTFYIDSDQDGYGSVATSQICSLVPITGYSLNNIDCDDTNKAVFTNATFYKDNDGDGLGNINDSVAECALEKSGYVTNSNDLNDSDPTNSQPPEEQPMLVVKIEGRYIYINDQKIRLFNEAPKSVEYDVVNYYDDGYTEIVVVGLFSNRATIVVLQVNNSDYSAEIVKKEVIRLPEKRTALSLKTKVHTYKFITSFNGLKIIWKIKKTAKFSKV